MSDQATFHAVRSIVRLLAMATLCITGAVALATTTAEGKPLTPVIVIEPGL